MPVAQQPRDGFMDIVDVQYHENTITRIYAYFLNRKKNVQLRIYFSIAYCEWQQKRASEAN